MAANMDTIGTFEIAEVFSKHKLITCLHKHYSVEDVKNWAEKVDKSVL
jgi:GMP reductase